MNLFSVYCCFLLRRWTAVLATCRIHRLFCKRCGPEATRRAAILTGTRFRTPARLLAFCHTRCLSSLHLHPHAGMDLVCRLISSTPSLCLRSRSPRGPRMCDHADAKAKLPLVVDPDSVGNVDVDAGRHQLLSENIAPLPLTWVVPLADVPAEFCCAFATLPGSGEGSFSCAGRDGLLVLCVAALDPLLMYRLRIALALMSSAFLLVCLSLHRELYLRRPDVQDLTRFYLFIATGGAIGAASIAVIAPLTIPIPIDFVLALSACGMTWPF